MYGFAFLEVGMIKDSQVGRDGGRNPRDLKLLEGASGASDGGRTVRSQNDQFGNRLS